MKKILILLLAVLLLLSLGGTASAAGFSDISSLSQSAQKSITRLTGLKVISGYSDGTFQPEGTITRAEFAKIAVIISGQESSAELLKNTPAQFSDVKTSEWYTGWINVAADHGYVLGFPDGSFRPNAKVSYAQALTVLLRVLGYDDRLPGDWPADYIAKATSLNVTEGVAISAPSPARRVDVAMMTSAVLDCNMMKWDAASGGFINNSTPAVTLLAANFTAPAAPAEPPVSITDADLAAVLDTYMTDGDNWVDIDLIGQTRSYQVRGSIAPIAGDLYTYSLSSGKFAARLNVFDPDVFQSAAVFTDAAGEPGSLSASSPKYAQVTDIDIKRGALEINHTWYSVDKDTEIYDYSDWYDDGSDPVYLDAIDSINTDDLIVFVDNGDNENIAKLLIIVNNIDK